MVGKGTFTMRETRILEFKETITNIMVSKFKTLQETFINESDIL